MELYSALAGRESRAPNVQTVLSTAAASDVFIGVVGRQVFIMVFVVRIRSMWIWSMRIWAIWILNFRFVITGFVAQVKGRTCCLHRQRN